MKVIAYLVVEMLSIVTSSVFSKEKYASLPFIREKNHENNKSLTMFLEQLIDEELFKCSLSLFGTTTSNYEEIVPFLIYLTTDLMIPIQVFDKLPQIDSVTTPIFKRESPYCDAYIFFLSDSFITNSPFIEFLNSSDSDWNYQGKIILVSLSHKDQIENWKRIIKLYKIKKTLDVISIWPTPKGQACEIWSHWVYSYKNVRKLATYKRPKDFKRVETYFPKKFQNFEGFPLVVVTFPHPPSIFANYDQSNGHFEPTGGVDIQVIKALAEALNFSITWKHPGPELWGNLLPSGTYSGLDGLISSDSGDIGVANIFMTLERSYYILFSAPYDFDRACFITPSARQLPYWLAITHPFSLSVWLVILCCFSTLPLILYVTARMQVEKPDSEFTRSFLFVLEGFTSRQPINNSTSDSLKLLTIGVCLLGFLLGLCFSGNLTAVFAVKSFEPPIKTMEDLYKSNHPIFGFSMYWKPIFETASNKYAQQLVTHYEAVDDLTSYFQTVANRRGALIDGYEFLRYTKAKHFTTRSGESPLRIQEECFSNYAIGAELNKFSPLKKNVDMVILNMQAGGLVHYFFEKIISGNYNDSVVDDENSWINLHGNELNDLDKRVGFLLANLTRSVMLSVLPFCHKIHQGLAVILTVYYENNNLRNTSNK